MPATSLARDAAQPASPWTFEDKNRSVGQNAGDRRLGDPGESWLRQRIAYPTTRSNEINERERWIMIITKPTSSSWIDYLKPNPRATVRLFCFHMRGVVHRYFVPGRMMYQQVWRSVLSSFLVEKVA